MYRQEMGNHDKAREQRHRNTLHTHDSDKSADAGPSQDVARRTHQGEQNPLQNASLDCSKMTVNDRVRQYNESQNSTSKRTTGVAPRHELSRHDKEKSIDEFENEFVGIFNRMSGDGDAKTSSISKDAVAREPVRTFSISQKDGDRVVSAGVNSQNRRSKMRGSQPAALPKGHADLVTANLRNVQLEARVKDLEEQLQHMGNRVQDNEAAMAAKDQKTTDIDRRARTVVKEMQVKVKEAESNAAKAAKDAERSFNKMNETEKVLIEEQKGRAASEEEIKMLHGKIKRRDAYIQELEKSNKKNDDYFMDRSRELNHEIDNLRTRYDEKTKIIQKLKARISELDGPDAQKRLGTLESSQQTLFALRLKYEEQKQKIKSLEDVISDFKARIADLNRQIETSDERIERCKTAAGKNGVAFSQDDYDKFLEEVTRLDAELIAKDGTIAELTSTREKEIQSRDATVVQLQSQVDAAAALDIDLKKVPLSVEIKLVADESRWRLVKHLRTASQLKKLEITSNDPRLTAMQRQRAAEQIHSLLNLTEARTLIIEQDFKMQDVSITAQEKEIKELKAKLPCSVRRHGELEERLESTELELQKGRDLLDAYSKRKMRLEGKVKMYRALHGRLPGEKDDE